MPAPTSRRRDDDPADPVTATQRRLVRGYVLALSLVAVLTLGAGFYLSNLVERQSLDASVINRVNAQRVLVERVAGLLDELATPHESRQAARETLDDSLRRLATSHASLSVGLDAPARETAALRLHYFDGPAPLDRFVSAFVSRGQALLADAQHRPLDPAAIDALRVEALGPLSDSLQMAIGLHEVTSRERIDNALRAHHAAVAVALVLLLLEALFIFRPLSTHVAALSRTLRREADDDPLTGLMNRRAVTGALAEVMAKPTPVAVVAIDLDHFKETNDAAGHTAGDLVLRTVASRLITCVRPSDVVGRTGGDEFTVLLIGVGEPDIARIVTERIRVALDKPVPHGDKQLRIGATIGVAIAPTDAETPDLVLRAADEALMRAKRDRRGTISFADRKDALQITRAAAIVSAFDESCGADGIAGVSAHLQPIVSLRAAADGPLVVFAFEALARWSHPELGPVSPGELLSVIGPERTARLGAAVRDDALNTLAALHAAGLTEARIALNLSAGEVMRADIALDIEAQVRRAGLSLDAVEIEITEEVLLDRVSDRTLEQLAALRGRGAKLMLDDFGTGTSGLSQLLRLPLDGVKLDKTFVQRLGSDRRAEEIVRATMSLARGLGLEVVGEGVETPQQAARLRALGCDAAQGFLFARPMPRAALEAWLVSGPGARPAAMVAPTAKRA